MSGEVREERAEDGVLMENVKTIALALVIALIIRAFFFQPFNIPSGSMIPTLLKGDFLFVSKFAYGYSRHSLPFSPPLFTGRIFGSEPERGDVVVFRNERDNGKDYIKRVIGLPGDRIQMRQGLLHINGEAVKREALVAYSPEDTSRYGTEVPRFRETLPNGVSYEVLDLCPPGEWPRCRFGRGDSTEEFVVPQGHYFMMGDNRDDSQDSRFAGQVGFVPHEKLIGRAEMIFFSTDGSAALWEVWGWPFAIRWSRLFNGLS